MINKILVLLLSLNLIYGIYDYSLKAKNNNSLAESASLFKEAASKLKVSYVDADKVTNDNLTTNALKGMLKYLDKYSTYYTPKQNERQEEGLQGSFAGIGVLFRMKKEGVFVRRVYENSPAEKAGVLAGDVILKAGDEDLRGMKITEVVSNLKGKPNSLVQVTLFRNDEEKMVEIKRGFVTVPSIKLPKMLDDEIAYMYLAQFGGRTAEDFANYIHDFIEQGAKGLILDLRFNGGGYLDSAVDISSMFLPIGKLVVYKEGRDAERVNLLDHTQEDIANFPIVILVNGDTASASEVISACLRDYKRCILVGEKTYGKGSVQLISPLSNGGSIRYTVAKYYTPGGYVIHDRGLKPDIEVKLDLEQEKNLLKTIGNFDTIDSEDPSDLQFKVAYEALQKELEKDLHDAHFFSEYFDEKK